MKRGLKCSKCHGHNADKRWGYNPKVGRRYHNKHCYDCGNDTPKVYYCGVITQAEYDKQMDEMHNHITEMLAKSK